MMSKHSEATIENGSADVNASLGYADAAKT